MNEHYCATCGHVWTSNEGNPDCPSCKNSEVLTVASDVENDDSEDDEVREGWDDND